MTLRDEIRDRLSDHDYEGDLDGWTDEDVERVVDDFDPEDDDERDRIDREVRDELRLRGRQEEARANTYRALTKALDEGRVQYGAAAWDRREIERGLLEELDERHTRRSVREPMVIGGRLVR